MIGIEKILFLIGLCIVAYIILKIIDSVELQQSRKKRYLSRKIKQKADRKYSKLLHRFKRNKRRNPHKNEKFRIIINASHITIRRRGKVGHWGRQKVRKYLLEKHKAVDKYKMK